MIIYVEGRERDAVVEVPLSSAVVVYLLTYCRCDSSFTLMFVGAVSLDNDKTGTKKCARARLNEPIKIQKTDLNHLSYRFVTKEELPLPVFNCELPVIQDEREYLVFSGLCCTVRHIVSASHEIQSTRGGDTSLFDLLGFRAGSLRACAEVSGWTKLCEVELPGTITQFITALRASEHCMEIPADVMKIDLHLEKPPPLHNVEKMKRQVLKQVQQTTTQLRESCESDQDTAIGDFFKTREKCMPHGNMYFRLLCKREIQQRKLINSENNTVCRFGCTEDKLVKGCAKCNDREKLRQKDRQKQRNEARVSKQKSSSSSVQANSGEGSNISIEGSRNQDGDVTRVGGTSDGVVGTSERVVGTSDGVGGSSDCGIDNIDELTKFVESLTIYDVVYDHKYAEGIQFTVADIMLFVYFYHLMDSMQFSSGCLLMELPYIHKWLKHIISLPRMRDTSARCGFNMAAVTSCLDGETGYHGNVVFSIPQVSLDVEEDGNDITRRSRGKHKALKLEIARVLDQIQGSCIKPVLGDHPRWPDVHVDWGSVPQAASPKTELPEKRVARKCEQLENLATAVQAIAKSGDIIVDFCSGSGHLGIILAYLLPECQVYLVENKEESLLRATARIKELNLSNITMYKCNMDYFHGHFDIGVCLHACGVATDLVLQQCLDKNASFVICPCCYGSIQTTLMFSYPRSQQYREADLKEKDVIILGHAADQTEDNIELNAQGRHCMNLVDTDRAQLARERGYSVTLCSLHPLSCTPKNNLLIGTVPSA